VSRTQLKHYIDRKLKQLFVNGFDEEPVETRIKVIAQAIAWEKVKAHIAERTDDEFDPDKI
jgi:hypothetical protein